MTDILLRSKERRKLYICHVAKPGRIQRLDAYLKLRKIHFLSTNILKKLLPAGSTRLICHVAKQLIKMVPPHF